VECNAQEAVSWWLVDFRGIAKLQQKNGALLEVVRELAGDAERRGRAERREKERSEGEGGV
jgi:hypothetical protein